MAWRLCPGFRTTARSLALKTVGVGEGAGKGEAMHAYQIRHTARSQADRPVSLHQRLLGLEAHPTGAKEPWSEGPHICSSATSGPGQVHASAQEGR